MKKIISLLLASIALGVLMIGCNKTPDPDTGGTPATSAGANPKDNKPATGEATPTPNANNPQTGTKMGTTGGATTGK